MRRGGGSPIVVANRAVVDGRGRPWARRRTRTSAVDPRGAENRDYQDERTQPEHEPVRVQTESRSKWRVSAIGKARRKGDRDDERGDDANGRGHDRRDHHRPDDDATIRADGPPGRQVGGAGADRPHERLPDEHARAHDDREREEQQAVALDLRHVPDLGGPEQSAAHFRR